MVWLMSLMFYSIFYREGVRSMDIFMRMYVKDVYWVKVFVLVNCLEWLVDIMVLN